MSTKEIVEAIAVTAELTSTQLSGVAMAAMAKDLMAEYPDAAILAALSRCRRELTGRLTQAAVVERIEQVDGRPGANEAWAIALTAFDESATVVLNDEIFAAVEAARPVMASGDEVGARMAFRDAYERIVREGRATGARPRWYPSLGTDPEKRALAIEAAVGRGLLPIERVAGLLPKPITDEEHARGQAIAGLLTGQVEHVPDAQFQARISELRDQLKGRRAPRSAGHV